MRTDLISADKKFKLIVDITGALLAALFFYTAVSKLLAFTDFQGQMRNQVFPLWFENLFIWTLPPLEILTALLLCFDRWRTFGFWLSLLLMTVFTIYIALVLGKVFQRVPCSCGGVLKALGWKAHLFFNLFFLLISSIGLRLIRRQKSDY